MFDDLQLINNVKRRPELYDTGNLKYLDTNYKNAVWKEIAEDLGTDVITCKSRWCNIRDNFRKSLKKSVLQTNKTKKLVKPYKYAPFMQFLLKFLVCEETGAILNGIDGSEYSACDVKTEENSLTQIDFQDACLDDDYHSASPLEPTAKRMKISQEFTEHTLSPSNSSNASPQHNTFENVKKYGNGKSTNEGQTNIRNAMSYSVDAFLAGLAPTLKTLSPIHWHCAKAEMFSVVQKYELKTIMGDSNEEL